MKLADGKEKWKFHTELGFKAAAAVRDGVAFVGDTDGKFYTIDAATGKEIWSVESGAEISAGANFYQDKVLFASQDGGLYCLAATDGKLAWKYTIDNMIQCSPTVAGNRGFLAGCDGKLHIVDSTTAKASPNSTQRPDAQHARCGRRPRLFRHPRGPLFGGRLEAAEHRLEL